MKVTFSCGVEWNVREVPPYATLRAQARVSDPEMPDMPMLERETALGSKELMPAAPDSPEYKAYLDAYREYRREKQTADKERERLAWEFGLLYAFEGLQAPNGWQPPTMAMQHVGLSPRQDEAGRLLDYIEFALLVTANDIALVNRAINGESAPLAAQEVRAAEKFRPGDEG